MEIRKISRRRPRTVDDAESGHFTLLFCRGRQINAQIFITHVHSYCTSNREYTAHGAVFVYKKTEQAAESKARLIFALFAIY